MLSTHWSGFLVVAPPSRLLTFCERSQRASGAHRTGSHRLMSNRAFGRSLLVENQGVRMHAKQQQHNSQRVPIIRVISSPSLSRAGRGRERAVWLTHAAPVAPRALCEFGHNNTTSSRSSRVHSIRFHPNQLATIAVSIIIVVGNRPFNMWMEARDVNGPQHQTCLDPLALLHSLSSR